MKRNITENVKNHHKQTWLSYVCVCMYAYCNCRCCPKKWVRVISSIDLYSGKVDLRHKCTKRLSWFSFFCLPVAIHTFASSAVVFHFFSSSFPLLSPHIRLVIFVQTMIYRCRAKKCSIAHFFPYHVLPFLFSICFIIIFFSVCLFYFCCLMLFTYNNKITSLKWKKWRTVMCPSWDQKTANWNVLPIAFETVVRFPFYSIHVHLSGMRSSLLLPSTLFFPSSFTRNEDENIVTQTLSACVCMCAAIQNSYRLESLISQFLFWFLFQNQLCVYISVDIVDNGQWKVAHTFKMKCFNGIWLCLQMLHTSNAVYFHHHLTQI